MRSGLDVLLVIGSSLHEFTTHVWDPALQPTEGLIQIDIDPEEMGKNYPVDVVLLGDAEGVLQALVETTERAKTGERHPADDFAALKKETEYFSEPAMRSTAVPLKPQRVMAELAEALPSDALVFTDIGNTVTWVERCLLVRRPDTTMSLSGLAAMGSGVAACIGGKLAQQARPTIAICGDGDFQMHGMEVMTAVSHDIPVVWLIVQNDRLAMVRDVQTMTYKSHYIASEFTCPDFVKMAESFGALGLRAEKPGEVAEAVTAAFASGRPAMVSARIDPDEMPPAKARMMAMERAWGNPPVMQSLSMGALKALWSMLKER